jgi:hypothetical protein
MTVKAASNQARFKSAHLKVAIIGFAVACIVLSLAAQGQSFGPGQTDRREVSIRDLDAVFPEAAIDRVRMGDLDVDFIQFIPRANREYTCIGLVNDRVVTDLECFPTKTNPSPTMY